MSLPQGLFRLLLLLAAWCSALPAAAFDMRRLTLEELMELNVYSASRRAEAWRKSPAAVYVLTAEDIRRARVTSVPEALRLVPGVQVARVDANKWAVSIRGFNSRTANKLQVMVDGRSIYDPLFSGVLWESRDIQLENIDRIEVIRGPGGTLWGANAVNGVINIVTKHALDTQGGLAVVGIGTEERAFTTLRYGWRSGERHAARVTARLVNRDQGYSSAGPTADDSLMGRVSLRWDWDRGAGDELRISSDLFDGRAGEYRQPDDPGALPGAVDVEHTGGNVSLNWTRRVSDANQWQARSYYERFTFNNPSVLREARDIYHLEFQNDLVLTDRQRLVWGANYRITEDAISDVRTFSFDPAARRDEILGAFVQDTIALLPTVELTLGTKVEHNDYTGTGWQPNVRLAYFPSERHMTWGAISRAIRTPARLDADIVFAGSRLGDGLDAERLTAYEIGHRYQPSSRWSFDTALFYNVYDDLQTLETSPRLRYANRMHGNTYGIEISNRWQLRPALRVDASYAYLRMDLTLDPDSTDVTQPGATEGGAPHHQAALRGEWDVGRDLELDVTLRYVDALPAQQIPAYTTMDVGLGWRLGLGLDWVVVGQNLFDAHHPELASRTSTEVQRGFYTKLNWRF